MTDSELLDILIKRYPEKRKELTKIFPIINENTPFIRPGKLFRRKCTKHNYVILVDKQRKKYIMANIDLGYIFQEEVPIKGYIDMMLPITVAQLNTLSGSTNDFYKEEDYVV